MYSIFSRTLAQKLLDISNGESPPPKFYTSCLNAQKIWDFISERFIILVSADAIKNVRHKNSIALFRSAEGRLSYSINGSPLTELKDFSSDELTFSLLAANTTINGLKADYSFSIDKVEKLVVSFVPY